MYRNSFVGMVCVNCHYAIFLFICLNFHGYIDFPYSRTSCTFLNSQMLDKVVFKNSWMKYSSINHSQNVKITRYTSGYLYILIYKL